MHLLCLSQHTTMTINTCGHPERKVFSKKRCKSCAQADYGKVSAQRKKEKRDKGEIKKPNQVSNQQKLLNKAYKILAAELKPLHPKCQGNLSGCTGKTTDIHHSKGRRGILLIISRYFKYLCHDCHDFCTVNSKEAKELGLSLPINSQTEYDFTEREKELIVLLKIRTPKDVVL